MPLRDFAYAFRTLRKSPVFAAAAVITLALGIGASSAIFSVTNAVLLRPLPYKDPGRLVFAITDMKRRNVKDFPFSNVDFLDLRRGTTEAFTDLGAVATGRAVVAREDGSPEQISRALATPDLFRMLGVQIAVGRDFTAADGEVQPAPVAGTPAAPVAPAAGILSYEYWQRRFGGDRGIVGRAMPGAQDGAVQIVGVLAPGFELLFPPEANEERAPDLWIANRIPYDTANRNQVYLRVIGRLRDGVTLDRAQSAVSRVAATISQDSLIKRTAGFDIRLEPMRRHVVQQARPALLALMGAVLFLLLIACANIANLLLVRSSLREREMAVRTALGGGRWRLAGQTLAEAAELAAAGAAAGLGLAWLSLRELRAIAPANLPRADSIAIDPAVVAFTCSIALAAAFLFGLVPALRASRPEVAQLLRAGGRTAGLGGAGPLSHLVVVAEVALCFVLLIGSGLMARSFQALQRIGLGYDPHALLTFLLLQGPGPAGQKPEQRAAAQREIQARLRGLAGVESVTASTPFPLAGGFSPIRWGLEPALTDSSKFQAADFQIVLPGYFETMRTPLLAGRTFTDADNAPGRNGVVVDQTLAAKAFPRGDAVGKRILVRVRTPEAEWVKILGVVAHQRDVSLAQPGREQIYFTDGFLSHGVASYWAMRTAGHPARYAAEVRKTLANLDPRVLLTEVQPMDVLVTRAQSETRFSLLLIGAFAAVAALLAAVGLYGVLSTMVRQRTAEIGVRMALGAAPGNVFQLVVGQGLRLSVVGLGIGVMGALGLTRLLTSLLVGVRPTDPATYVAMAVLFMAIAAAASWAPAWRAATLDPSAALRQE